MTAQLLAKTRARFDCHRAAEVAETGMTAIRRKWCIVWAVGCPLDCGRVVVRGRSQRGAAGPTFTLRFPSGRTAPRPWIPTFAGKTRRVTLRQAQGERGGWRLSGFKLPRTRRS